MKKGTIKWNPWKIAFVIKYEHTENKKLFKKCCTDNWIIGASMLGRKTASMFKSTSSQWNSISARSDNRYPLVSMSCALTLESTSFRFSLVLCWLGILELCALWLFKNSDPRDYKKLQAAREFSWDFFVIY